MAGMERIMFGRSRLNHSAQVALMGRADIPTFSVLCFSSSSDHHEQSLVERLLSYTGLYLFRRHSIKYRYIQRPLNDNLTD